MQVVSFVDAASITWYINLEGMTITEEGATITLHFVLALEELDEEYPDEDMADLVFQKHEDDYITNDFLQTLPILNSFPVHEEGMWKHWVFVENGEIGMFI